MIVGLVRVSRFQTSDDLALQQRELDFVGAKKIFTINGSAKEAAHQFEEVFSFCREGDVLTATSLDRLSGSVGSLCEAISRLRAKSVDIHILDIGLDTRTTEGVAMLRVFETLKIFSAKAKYENQRDGIERARIEGRYKGRKPTARAKSPQVLHAYRMGRTIAQIVREFGIGRASVYRILESGGMWPPPPEPRPRNTTKNPGAFGSGG